MKNNQPKMEERRLLPLVAPLARLMLSCFDEVTMSASVMEK
jgi:hypothetical protein